MMNSSIEDSGLLITRTLQRHKHQLRDFFNRHDCCRKFRQFPWKRTFNSSGVFYDEG